MNIKIINNIFYTFNSIIINIGSIEAKKLFISNFTNKNKASYFDINNKKDTKDDLFLKLKNSQFLIFDNISHSSDIKQFLKLISSFNIKALFICSSFNYDILNFCYLKPNEIKKINYKGFFIQKLFKPHYSKKLILKNILDSDIDDIKLENNSFLFGALDNLLSGNYKIPCSEVRLHKALKIMAIFSCDVFNNSKAASYLGVSSVSFAKYIKFFNIASIVCIINPLIVDSKKRLVKSPKYFFYNTSLLCRLLNINNVNQLLQHPMRNIIWSNFVISNICKILDYKLYDIAFYKTHNLQEAQFVIIKNNKPIFVIYSQFQFTPLVTRKMKSAISDLGGITAFFILPFPIKNLKLEKNIYALSLNKFINKL